MFRKRLFTLDTNDTNAAESKFGVVKDAVENEFNGIYLTSTSSYAFCQFFDARIKKNNLRITKTSLSTNIPDPAYRTALQKAAAVMNRTGWRLLQESCNVSLKREKRLRVSLQTEQ